jgi:hypothetical protein
VIACEQLGCARDKDSVCRLLCSDAPILQLPRQKRRLRVVAKRHYQGVALKRRWRAGIDAHMLFISYRKMRGCKKKSGTNKSRFDSDDKQFHLVVALGGLGKHWPFYGKKKYSRILLVQLADKAASLCQSLAMI